MGAIRTRSPNWSVLSRSWVPPVTEGTAASRTRVLAPRSYRPGGWFGIFGEHATIILPPSEKSRVAALWELVDDGAGFDETLDALIAGGLRGLPGFVLISDTDGKVKVLLRGSVTARFVSDDGGIELDGLSATTWVEHSLTGVTSMRVSVEGNDNNDNNEDFEDGADLAMGHGLVRISRLDQPAVTVRVASQAAAQVLPPPSRSQALTPGDDHDGMTHAGLDTGEFARQPPGIPGQPPAPSVTARPVARLLFSSGEVIEVDRVVLVGRAPEARRFTSTDQPRLVTVPSPNQEISSTHLEIRPGSGVDHGSAVVIDLGSTNGTTVEQPGLGKEDLKAGTPVQLIPGASLDLGDGATIRIANP